MFSWLRKPDGANFKPIHPPWKAGQYVTYFLERDDGSWVALALRLLGQEEEGSWILCGDFKTKLGEITVWFRCDPTAPAEMPDIIPIQQQPIREFSTNPEDKDSFAEDPNIAISLAMNLLWVRRWPAAAEALRGEARKVCYPCGIDRAHLLITPGLDYEKHHDINPCVMLTGVSCLSVDGSKHPMIATSFGLSDPAVAVSTSYDDFVDLSHLKSVDHDGFTLTYPATWFLHLEAGENDQRMELRRFSAQLGGITCSASLSVAFHNDTPEKIIAERDIILSRLSSPLDGLLPRNGEPLRVKGDGRGFLYNMDRVGIDGLALSVVYLAAERDRLAHIIATGCAAKANPRGRTTLTEMEHVFREILESFRFI